MSDRDPSEFTKCPNCHRKTVKMMLHIDGDVSFECLGCGELAVANPLNESPRVYE